MHFHALACHNATRHLINRQSPFQALWISDDILHHAYQRFTYRVLRRQRLSTVANTEPPTESSTIESPEHGVLEPSHRFEHFSRKTSPDQKQRVELHKGGNTDDYAYLLRQTIQRDGTESIVKSALHDLQKERIYERCGPLEHATTTKKSPRQTRSNWNASRFSKELRYILEKLSAYNAIAVMSCKELADNLCVTIRRSQASLEEILKCLYCLQDLRSHSLVQNLLEYALPKLKDSIEICKYDLTGQGYLKRIVFLLESAPDETSVMRLRLDVWIDRLNLARGSGFKTQLDTEHVISMSNRENHQIPFKGLKDDRNLPYLNSLIDKNSSSVLTGTENLFEANDSGHKQEARVLNDWLQSLVSSLKSLNQPGIVYKPDASNEEIYNTPALWSQLYNEKTPGRPNWHLMVLPGIPPRESCRLILDSLNRRLLQPTGLQEVTRNILTKEMMRSIIHCFEIGPAISYKRKTSPKTSEFVLLIQAFSIMQYYNKGLISSITQLVYQSQSIEEFVKFMNDLCRVVIEYKLESPHEFLYTLTRFLMTIIPDNTDFDNSSNQHISNAVIEIYRDYLGVFYAPNIPITQSPFYLAGLGKMKGHIRARSILSSVVHRLAVIDTFSPNQTWHRAANLTEIYYRILRSADIPVLRPMALALIHANIVRPLQEQRGITRSRAAWALREIGKIENSEEMMKRLDFIMQMWQAEVVKSKRLQRWDTWLGGKHQLLQEAIRESEDDGYRAILGNAPKTSYDDQ
jgi:hypothetical protein